MIICGENFIYNLYNSCLGVARDLLSRSHGPSANPEAAVPENRTFSLVCNSRCHSNLNSDCSASINWQIKKNLLCHFWKMEAEQKGHSTFKPKRNQPKELTPISEEDSFRLVPSSQFISLLKVVLHEHKRGPLVDGDQLNLLGTMCQLDSPLEKEHLNVNYQYCVADLWLLSLSAASKVYGATFKPSCDKSQKETIIRKLGLKPIQSADKCRLGLK